MVVVQNTVTGFAPEDQNDRSTLYAPDSPNNLTCYLATEWKTEAEEIADD